SHAMGSRAHLEEGRVRHDGALFPAPRAAVLPSRDPGGGTVQEVGDLLAAARRARGRGRDSAAYALAQVACVDHGVRAHRAARQMSKRLFDVVVSVVALIVVSPILAAAAVAIKLGSKGPVFFRQARIGLNGRPFQMYKFRTMVVGADRMGPSSTA